MAGNIAKRPNGKWRARYRDEAGNERARHFNRKIDAQRWLDEISSTVMAGTYVDPAGREDHVRAVLRRVGTAAVVGPLD